MLGFIERTVGEEAGTLRFKRLSGHENSNLGSVLDDFVENVVNFVWLNNGRSIVYTRMNVQLRPYQVIVHHLQSDTPDSVIFTELDDKFFVDVSLTKDKKYVTINCNSRSTSEVHIFDSSHKFTSTSSVPNLKIICPRRQGIEYFVDHHDEMIYIVTNAFDGTDFTLAYAPTRDPSYKNWKKLLNLDVSYKLEDVDVFHDHVVLYAKKDGLPAVLVHEIPSSETHLIPLPEPICTVVPGVNRDYYTDNVRFNVICAGYRELVFEYRFKQKQLLTIRKVAIPGFKRDDYVISRIQVPLSDDLCVQDENLPNFLPVTLFHKSNVAIPNLESFAKVQLQHGKTVELSCGTNEKIPVLVQAYNSYGMESSLPFDPVYSPLLDNGWIIATCHGPGGSEYGKGWYRKGTGAKGKTRSIDQVAFFIDKLKKSSSQLLISGIGVSAGGCIMGSALGKSWQFSPDGSRISNSMSCAVLHVPFLDPLSAMKDPNEALTTTEHEEWGNPLESSSDEAIISQYSPYELIPNLSHNQSRMLKQGECPSILLTSGMLDQRVAYWHPLKWTARMRTRMKQIYGNEDGDSRLFMLTRKHGGHFEDTAESSIEDSAWWISFLLYEIEKRQKNSKL